MSTLPHRCFALTIFIRSKDFFLKPQFTCNNSTTTLFCLKGLKTRRMGRDKPEFTNRKHSDNVVLH